MLYRTLELTVAPALRAVYRPLITGLEHVPHDGAVILAGNHISFADEIFTPLAARRQVCYLAKSEYFTTPGPRGRVMAAFFGGMGLVPVDRDLPAAPDPGRGPGGHRHPDPDGCRPALTPPSCQNLRWL